jgi:protein-tyrosine phosphatase
MAEALFHRKINMAGLGKSIEADSAATGPWHVGEQPHPGTLKVLAQQGIVFKHTAREITKDDLTGFDYVLALDSEILADIQALGPPTDHVELLLKYAPDLGLADVPDPYYTGRFQEVYMLVDKACDGLLNTIQAAHNL